MAFGPGFGLAQANSAKGRIDIERVNGNAVADFTLGAVEEVCGGDLEVVVRRVGESAAAVAIAERPDVRNVGLQRFVDDNIAMRVNLDACGFEPEVVGIRAATDGE